MTPYGRSAQQILDVLRGGAPDRVRAERCLELVADVDRKGHREPRYGTPGDEGYEEWCQLRACITVSLAWVRAADLDDGVVQPHRGAGMTYAIVLADAEALARECVGDLPRKGRERWLAGVRERCTLMARQCQTKDDARKAFEGLLDGGERRYVVEYRALYDEFVASFPDVLP